MSTEDFSTWTLRQLFERLWENNALVEKNDKRGLPVGDLLDEGDRILAAIDKQMEPFKGTAMYDEYWRVRQVKGELPKMPPGFDPRWQ
ncbi:MAG: hypothetical protein NT105_01465 [Verrucomicrobia bacterium]|nr:hypothetical protein [Verrucomicrobiota bacterium]